MTAALIYLAILVVAFFLLIVLPQRRRMAAHRALVDAMDVGDEIVTTAGIHGIVREIGEATLAARDRPRRGRDPGARRGRRNGVVPTRRRLSTRSGRRRDPALDGSPGEPRPSSPRSAD